jgi:hypothetical protein
VSARIRLALLLVMVLPLVVSPEAGAVPGSPTPVCSPAPTDCSGWYRTNVTVSWSYDQAGVTNTEGCNIRTVTSDTADFPLSCVVTYGSATFGFTAHVKRDATPPQVTGAAPDRAPDANGWFNRPVAVAFAGADATSGIASCDRPTYASDSASAQVSGTCRDVAGNTSAPQSVGLKYDGTAPAVTAAPDRAPDGNGWYRKPLTVAFNGADATSGIESCTQPARYAGPDRAEVAIAGTCRDHAGNAAAATLAAKYDATAPKLAAVEAKLTKGIARLGWKKPADAVLVRIDRVPGVNGRKKTRVYKGIGQAFVDRTVRTGVRYRYELIATDAAGNVAGTAVTADARSTLYAPVDGAVVRAPVRLAWEPLARARYYNVQLHRNGVKVLSLWPTKPRLELARTWRYLGKSQKLTAGLYRWFVWPALGTRAKPRFGRVLGSSTFRVR